MDHRKGPRSAKIRPFDKQIYLSSPTLHGEEQKWVNEAIQTNWVSTVGPNIQEVERWITEKIGRRYAVALSSGTAALHLAIRLCAEKLYEQPKVGHGALEGHKVFASDMTFDATVNPIAYEGGEAVFIDTEYDTWNMDPLALERAFEIYPDVRLVVIAHLYGTPGKLDEIKEICERHHALIVEDAAESFGSTYNGIQTGMFGTGASILSFNGNKIVTGGSGGMFLTDDPKEADKIRKWSNQAREDAPWYQHEELGYNYRMSNIVAGILRGQLPYLEEHIAQKKAIYERYRGGVAGLPVRLNPFDSEKSRPNHWLICLLIDKEAMCQQVRSEREALYIREPGKSCPSEILDALRSCRAEGRPIWKPMHMQPIYRMNPFITKNGNGRTRTGAIDVGADIFDRGLCLPSDNKMTMEQVDRVVEIVRGCFEGSGTI